MPIYILPLAPSWNTKEVIRRQGWVYAGYVFLFPEPWLHLQDDLQLCSVRGQYMHSILQVFSSPTSQVENSSIVPLAEVVRLAQEKKRKLSLGTSSQAPKKTKMHRCLMISAKDAYF